MKYYAVIDTNVLVSAMLRWESIPGKIMEQVFIGDIIPLLNEKILKEYMEVLERPKFGFAKNATNIILEGFLKRGIFVDAENTDERLPDPKDEVFYAVVIEKRKTEEVYLITGTIKHFPDKSFVVTPREMLSIMEMDK